MRVPQIPYCDFLKLSCLPHTQSVPFHHEEYMALFPPLTLFIHLLSDYTSIPTLK